MNIIKLFNNKKDLEKKVGFFLNNNQIKIIDKNLELVESHIQKAKHNISFYKLNKKNIDYNDWLIVILYYSLYHTALALIAYKNYSSKNHLATILILIKEYSISEKEIRLIEELSINEADAKLYTDLKEDRHNASYATKTRFNNQTIDRYEEEVIRFINKAEDIIEND